MQNLNQITSGPVIIAQLLVGKDDLADKLDRLPEPYRHWAQGLASVPVAGNKRQELFDTYLAGLPMDARRSIMSELLAIDPLAKLDDDIQGDVDPLPPGDDMPDLPDSAKLPEKVLKDLDCSGQWLTDYVGFACKAAPMSPREYHEVLGLTLLSAAIARRVVLYASTDEIYPNLYSLLVGPSTIIKKSTAFRVTHKVMQGAEIRRFRLSDSVTPESLIDELTGAEPINIDRLETAEKEEFRLSQVFAGQRAWLMEEASGLFDAFGREHLAALKNLVLDLYDCPDRRDYSTRGKGLMIIKRAYLTICGPSTYAAMKRHFKSPQLWEDGVFSRFIFATPMSLPTQYTFYPDRMDIPADLTQSLRALALERLPLPESTVGKGVEPITITLADGVWERWEAYGRALEFELLKTNKVPPQLHPNYGRLKMSAMKTAMCLAVADWSASNRTQAPKIGIRHWARAQMMAEGWRKNLHRLVSTVERSSTEDIFEVIARKLSPSVALTHREIAQALNKTSSAREYAELADALSQMEKAGIVSRAKRRGKRGRVAEGWVLNNP